MEWQEFSEEEEPEVLTGISILCDEGRHLECPGHAKSEEHGDDTVVCLCSCHRMAGEA
jgi:hypothetical protein